ncbi:hypothetical protein GKA01_13680 [Gluconobacter kanchanaburiensis NBRC 103587]|uniref:Uncharacterized protein n=1 Tax=Gluconobacter kanchanaburiensis NBRC 103587 TaxID=1307948 RepID=A0A511B8Y9_9PROT|nr:hypothetical protein GKA01_13680 [Gluconobacter kanchanaburiensis NBRC 103587]
MIRKNVSKKMQGQGLSRTFGEAIEPLIDPVNPFIASNPHGVLARNGKGFDRTGHDGLSPGRLKKHAKTGCGHPGADNAFSHNHSPDTTRRTGKD